MQYPIRILHIVPSMNIRSGIASYIMNYYRFIDRSKFQFDFIVHSSDKNSSYISEINKLGGKIYIMPKLEYKNIFCLLNKIRLFFRYHSDYKVVHCHMANGAIFYLRIAKKYCIPIRILHSHNTQGASKVTHRIRNYPLNSIGKLYANINIACSKKAGRYLFRKNKFFIINNAIEAKKFLYNSDIREKVRKDLNLSDKFIIGHIGRFDNEKNHDFLIDVFKSVNDIYHNSILMLIGDGKLENKIKDKVKKLNIQKNVIFLGTNFDINRYLQAMDVFVLPSIYEGLGIVAIEAQASGLKTIVSNTVPNEVMITDNLKYLNLNSSPKIWADVILQYKDGYVRENMYHIIKNSGYDIDKASKKLENFYLMCLRRLA